MPIAISIRPENVCLLSKLTDFTGLPKKVNVRTVHFDSVLQAHPAYHASALSNPSSKGLIAHGGASYEVLFL